MKPAADAGGQTITICLFTTAVDEPKRHTTSAVNRKAAIAAGAKTATPAMSSAVCPRRPGKMPTAPDDGGTGEATRDAGADEDEPRRVAPGDGLRPARSKVR